MVIIYTLFRSIKRRHVIVCGRRLLAETKEKH